MIVLVRADATAAMGTGHVMRCAALGMRLMARGATAHFVCAGLNAELGKWLIDRNFGLTSLPHPDAFGWRKDVAATGEVARRLGHIDLLIVDHYGLEQQWEQAIRPYVCRILVIDDLANRNHDCDYLLDQNLRDDSILRYARCVPHGSQQFLGPQYALLRPEFDEADLERTRDGNVAHLLVFFGGTDPGDQTLKVLDALRALGQMAPRSVLVLGPAHPHRDIVYERAAGLAGVQVLDATDQMARLIAQADLALGTCGVAAWERCALGLPALVVVTAENQREDAEILCRLGAVRHLGDADGVSAEQWTSALQEVMDSPDCVRSIGIAAREVMMGRQAALAELEETLVDGIL